MLNARPGWMRPGRLTVALLAMAAVAAACTGRPAAPTARARVDDRVVTAVGAIGITVADLDRSVAFYTTVLDFEKVSEVELGGPAYDRLHDLAESRVRQAHLRLGDETIHLTEYRSPRGRPVPPDSRSHDRWFQHIAIIVNDMERAYARLRVRGVEHISPAPQLLPDWNPAAGGIRAFYFKDPDGHALEILQFPPGKGDRRWHRAADRLFLGIDHSAIAVADTAAGLAFYRDALGMRIAGTSENWGPEQERLNNVPGAHLRITTLRAASGPGVEFLEYVTPRDGRLLTSPRANDLTHWEIVLVATDVRRVAAVLGNVTKFVSRGVIEITGPGGTTSEAVVVRDPDGHAVRLISSHAR